MKNILKIGMIVAALSLSMVLQTQAQEDTVKIQKVKLEQKIEISIKSKDSTSQKSVQRANMSLTFTRFDLGLTKLNDNGSLSLSSANDFLDYRPWKTSHISFDVLELGYRFSENFKIYTGAGFDWTLIRLDKNITIQKNQPQLDYVVETYPISKNRFSSSYLHVPLNFEFRTKRDDRHKRFYVVVGPEIAFLMDGKIKQVSAQNGKQKEKDDYHFTPFRYGATARIGYGGLGIFFKYNATDMFDTQAQSGLKSMAFGLTFGL